MTAPMQLDFHLDAESWPEWGSAPRGPVVSLDMAHAGELLDSVIGANPTTGAAQVYHVVRCEICILAHAWPLPAPEALALYYAEQFYQQDKPEYVARYEQDQEWWLACVHAPILRQCAGVLGDMRGRAFLDIGAGPGLALDAAALAGMRTAFVEPNAALAAQLENRGHHWRGQTLEGISGADPADIAYLYEVLEHQPNPEDFLLRCADLLPHGGLLVVVVPNDYNPLQLAAQTALALPRWWLAPPQHLNYFTPKTLQLLLRRCGFSLFDMRGTYPLEQHILSGQNYIGNDAIGRQVHGQRKAMELDCASDPATWASLMDSYRVALGGRREGREIVCIARKNA